MGNSLYACTLSLNPYSNSTRRAALCPFYRERNLHREVKRLVQIYIISGRTRLGTRADFLWGLTSYHYF